MSTVEEISAWYDHNYDVLGYWAVPPTDKVYLGDKNERVCRFCGRRTPDVTFRMDAHAIPEALGNKSLFTFYECDQCNQAFGRGIEDDLGKWSKPMRAFSRVRGKSSIPTLIKGGEAPGWRIEHKDGLVITQYEGDTVCVVDEEQKQVRFTLKRDSYTPVAVLKALVRIGLTLMPESEIKNFPHALAWIKEPDHSKPFAEECPVLYTFIPGPMPNDLLVAWILRRKEDVVGVPYSWLVLAYGNEVFQVMLPSQAKGDGNSKFQSVFRFPTPSLEPAGFGPARYGDKDLTGRDVVRGEEFSIIMGFDQLVEKSDQSSACVGASSTDSNDSSTLS